jgi:hypothetical protein
MAVAKDKMGLLPPPSMDWVADVAEAWYTQLLQMLLPFLLLHPQSSIVLVVAFFFIVRYT